MRCRILHESGRRMRVRMLPACMTMAQADILEYYLLAIPYVLDAKVSDRTGDAAIIYRRTDATRQDLIAKLASFCFEDKEAAALVPEQTGRAIAREVADITTASESLEELVFLRRLSAKLMRRIKWNYRFIVSFNGLLIALGIAGILAPSSSALLHNASTVITGLTSMTPLEEKTDRRAVPDTAVV